MKCLFAKTNPLIIKQAVEFYLKNKNSDDDFNQSNFGLVEYIDKKGEKRPMFEMKSHSLKMNY